MEKVLVVSYKTAYIPTYDPTLTLLVVYFSLFVCMSVGIHMPWCHLVFKQSLTLPIDVPDPHSCVVCALPTEPSSWLPRLYFKIYKRIISQESQLTRSSVAGNPGGLCDREQEAHGVQAKGIQLQQVHSCGRAWLLTDMHLTVLAINCKKIKVSQGSCLWLVVETVQFSHVLPVADIYNRRRYWTSKRDLGS